MRAVVTGGAGFIASHLVERLLEEGHQVAVLDNFSNGTPANLEHLTGNPQLSVHQVDIANWGEAEPFMADAQWVFHLAGLADIVPSVEDPVKYHRANVDGTVAILEAARGAGVQRFVYAASSSCYGIPDRFPTTESDPISVMYPYALTKYIAEQYVLHWGKVYKLPCVSLRLFNVYGPRSRASGTYGAVFGVFLAQKLAGQPYTVVGDGTQTRDFVFVTDVANAFLRAAESDLEGEILNVASGNTYSINQLVSLLGGDVVHIPKRPGEPDCTHADISKIQRLLGWQPSVSFEKGVETMLHNISHWKDAPLWDVPKIEKATSAWFKALG